MSQEDKDTTGPDESASADAKAPPTASDEVAAPEEGDAAAAESTEAEAPEKAEPTTEERLAASEKEKKALRERMLRVAADYENFRKRSNREVGDMRKRSRQDTIKDLLPVFDNLERATAHADQAPDVATLSEGLRMVLKQFVDTLGKMEIERIDAEGEPFDPSLHESIQYEHSDEHAAGLVIKALQPGYRMGTQLLRPALVVVSRGSAAAEASDEASSTEDGDAATEESGAS